MAEFSTVAVIPARGGSKGLPRKNILPLCGKPLLAYSIEAALACDRIQRVLVSTEDEEIAKVAVKHGAEVPFLRPASLAGDHVTPGRAIDHLVRALYGPKPKALAMAILYPTHPFRPKGLLALLMDKVLAGHRVAQTVRAIAVRPQTYVLIGKSGRITPLLADAGSQSPGKGGRRASPPVYHRPYGLGEAVRFCPLRDTMPAYFHVIEDQACLIDIDFPEDMLLAEMILQHKLFDFEAPHAAAHGHCS